LAASRYNVKDFSMDDKFELIHRLLSIFPDYDFSRAKEATSEQEILAPFVLYLVESAKNNQTEGFSAFFDQVEAQIIYGSDEVRHMLIVGLLENLKNSASVQNLDYAIFEPWLGAETFVAWRWLEKRWQGSASLADSARFGKKDRDPE
jgi:hypothetical protein